MPTEKNVHILLKASTKPPSFKPPTDITVTAYAHEDDEPSLPNLSADNPLHDTSAEDGRGPGKPRPVLDLSIRCGQRLLEVSLWREEALCELYLGDEVQ
ncbi:unnamed protein product [Leuciscus chuanchicus]